MLMERVLYKYVAVVAISCSRSRVGDMILSPFALPSSMSSSVFFSLLVLGLSPTEAPRWCHPHSHVAKEINIMGTIVGFSFFPLKQGGRLDGF